MATQFKLTKQDIEIIVPDWLEEWNQLVVEEHISIELDTLMNGTIGTQGE